MNWESFKRRAIHVTFNGCDDDRVYREIYMGIDAAVDAAMRAWIAGVDQVSISVETFDMSHGYCWDLESAAFYPEDTMDTFWARLNH